MESRFGHRFDQVRIHADRTGADSARDLDARAYTFGEHVVFGASQFSPDTHSGQRLLAHELTHVLQQRAHGATVQRAPDQTPTTAGDLALPWRHGDHSLFEVTSAGVRFLVAWSSEQESAVRQAIPAIAKRISADNSRISDTSRRVRTCIIANSTTRTR